MNAPGVRGRPLEESRVLLEQSVVEIGGKPFNKSMLNNLFVPDWDFLRLVARYITFGGQIKFENTTCRGCGRQYQPVINLDELSISNLNDGAVEWIEAGGTRVPGLRLSDCDHGFDVLVRIPQVKDLKSIEDLAGSNQIAASNKLLCDCVESFTYQNEDVDVRGQMLVLYGEDSMEIYDWDALNTAWNESQPGPDLWASMACTVCNQKELLNLESSDFMNPTQPERRES